MIRIHIICEGQTEESFVNELLKPHFANQNIFVDAKLLGATGHQGGRVVWERLWKDIRNLLQSDPTAYCTTFFDYYGLGNDFPNKLPVQASIYLQSENICNGMKASLTERFPKISGRFIPYIQFHEFESLLFSDTALFAKSIDRNDIADTLQDIRGAFESPEHINDHPDTAPSKRLTRIIREYNKPLYGVMGALDIGLEKMQSECRLFRQWLETLSHLEALG